jgi:hypothetical protein
MKIRAGFVSNSSSTSFLVAARYDKDACPHCKRGDINILDLIEYIGGDCEETRMRARGFDRVERFYVDRMVENGYDPTKRLPDGKCPVCECDRIELFKYHPDSDRPYQMGCTACGVRGPAQRLQADARESWRKMTGSDDVDKWELDALQTLNEKIRGEGKRLTDEGWELAWFDISYHDSATAKILDMGTNSGSIIILESDI